METTTERTDASKNGQRIGYFDHKLTSLVILQTGRSAGGNLPANASSVSANSTTMSESAVSSGFRIRGNVSTSPPTNAPTSARVNPMMRCWTFASSTAIAVMDMI
jgi:hypothetical protein